MSHFHDEPFLNALTLENWCYQTGPFQPEPRREREAPREHRPMTREEMLAELRSLIHHQRRPHSFDWQRRTARMFSRARTYALIAALKGARNADA